MQVSSPNYISIGSAIFAGQTNVTNRQTDHATALVAIGRIELLLWCSLKIEYNICNAKLVMGCKSNQCYFFALWQCLCVFDVFSVSRCVLCIAVSWKTLWEVMHIWLILSSECQFQSSQTSTLRCSALKLSSRMYASLTFSSDFLLKLSVNLSVCVNDKKLGCYRSTTSPLFQLKSCQLLHNCTKSRIKGLNSWMALKVTQGYQKGCNSVGNIWRCNNRIFQLQIIVFNTD